MTKELFDLDAVEREAHETPFGFEFRGSTWYLAHPGMLPIDDLAAAERGDLDTVKDVLRVAFNLVEENPPDDDDIVVEPDQWKRFDALPNKGVAAYHGLLRQWMRDSGFELGESVASSRSSSSTARPSKRISSGRQGGKRR